MVSRKKTVQSTSVSSYFMVSKNDLPLSCPTAQAEAWCLHPRVYLPITQSGEVTCPYCSTRYILNANQAGRDHQ